MSTQMKQLKSFVSAPIGTDLSQVVEALQENSIHILDPAKFAPGAVKITDKIIDGINHADLVVAVLGTTPSSGNVLFELGCASALGKRTLVIVPEGYEIPSDVRDLAYIRTTPNNREAISFALEQILNAPAKETSQESRLLDTSKPLGSLADELLDRLYVLSNAVGETRSEIHIMSVVQDMLEASGSLTVAEPGNFDRGFDFAVWIDELEPYFGNPILVEVKNKLHTNTQVRDVAERVLRYSSLSNSSAGIIFAAQMSPEAAKAASSYPNLYFFDLRDLLKRLRQESLSQILRNERNARVHGIR